MKKLIPYVLLLILPIVFLMLLVMYKTSIGEYYIASFYDPSFNYLLNSLNLAQLNGYGVGFVFHPGTPIQVVGAITIKVLYTLNGEKADIVRDVFSRPEFYLSKIHFVLVLMNTVALYILGLVTYQKLRNIYDSIFIQLTPFFSSTIFFVLSIVTGDALLIFSVLILITLAISNVNKKNETSKNSIKYAIGFGIICGLGLASKITFFPLLVIPLILVKRISFKALFLLITATAFFIFIFPAISYNNAVSFLNWIESLTIHSGKYGGGSENIIDTSTFVPNLKTIFLNELSFSFAYVLITATLILQFFPRFKKINKNKYFKLLTGIFIAMTIQVLIVAKHFELYYMIPAVILSILGLFAVNSILAEIFPIYLIKKKLVLSLVIVIFSYPQIKSIIKSNSYFSRNRDESRNAMGYLEENYQQAIKVTTRGVSSKEYALNLGIFWSGTQKSKYSSVLKELSPDWIYYDRVGNQFYDIMDTTEIKAKLLSSDKFIFQCNKTDVINNFMKKVKQMTGKQNASYKKVFSNFRGESIYEIYLEQPP